MPSSVLALAWPRPDLGASSGDPAALAAALAAAPVQIGIAAEPLAEVAGKETSRVGRCGTC